MWMALELSDPQAEIVHYLEGRGMSLNQAASSSGCSYKAAQMRLARARKKLEAGAIPDQRAIRRRTYRGLLESVRMFF